MKKIKIAAGVAALGIAALPVASTFAVSQTYTEQIQVTVGNACHISISDPDNTEATSTGVNYSKTIDFGDVIPGNLYTSGSQNPTEEAGTNVPSGSTIAIACNNSADVDWNLKAHATNGGKMIDAISDNDEQPNYDIATGPATTGATSNWAFKMTSTVAGEIANGYGTSFVAIPTSDQVVARNLSTGAAQESAITPVYQVYVGSSQNPGTYTGTVVYTLSSPAV